MLFQVLPFESKHPATEEKVVYGAPEFGVEVAFIYISLSLFTFTSFDKNNQLNPEVAGIYVLRKSKLALKPVRVPPSSEAKWGRRHKRLCYWQSFKIWNNPGRGEY